MRFNLDMIDNTRYISIPTELFTNRKYDLLDIMSKTIYGVLKSRMNLSRANGWTEENGDIFFYMPIDELAELLQTSKGTISRKLAALEEAGLLERQHLASSRCHRMYLHQIETESSCQQLPAPTAANSLEEEGNAASQAADTEARVAAAKLRVSPVQPIYNTEIQEENTISVNNNNMYTKNVVVENCSKNHSFNSLQAFLQNIGMAAHTITDTCKKYSIERIQEVIKILKNQSSSIRNSAGFIVAALRFNYLPPVTNPDLSYEDKSCKYVPISRPEPNFETPEFIEGMKNTIEQLFKRRGSIFKPYQNWLDAHNLTMQNGKVIAIA